MSSRSTNCQDTVVRALPTRQARSRKTLDRLIDAAIAVLQDRGLDGATVPAIARQAGMSVGVVYRRFPDKDTMLRAVYERVFADALAHNRAALDPEHWRGQSAAAIARTVIGGMAAGYRLKRGLLRALVRYAETHHDPEFRRRAAALNRETLRQTAEVLLAASPRTPHPDPRRAVEFGMLVVGAALRVFVLADEPRVFRAPVPDPELGEELTRVFLGYLGLEPPRRADQASTRRARRLARTGLERSRPGK